MRRTLDINICSYILRRHPASMIERFAALERDQVWLSAIVAAELRFGAAKLASARFSAAVEAWVAGFDVRPWPLEATHFYALLRTPLERLGKPAMELLNSLAETAVDGGLVKESFVTTPLRELSVCLCRGNAVLHNCSLTVMAGVSGNTFSGMLIPSGEVPRVSLGPGVCVV